MMKTYPLSSDDGALFAFELDNAYISRNEIARLLKVSQYVTDVELQGYFGSPDDIRVGFTYAGERFVVWEPFGDNSRYWIGPKEPEHSRADVNDLKRIFDAYQPPFFRRLIGDLVTFKLSRRAR